jgi:hypothetical protein
MSSSDGKEKTRVREEIMKYYSSKQGYDFKRFGKFEKVKLGGNTWMYLVETIMTDGTNYALVPVNRAFVQGIIILNSDQLAKIVKAFIDGLRNDFDN